MRSARYWSLDTGLTTVSGGTRRNPERARRARRVAGAVVASDSDFAWRVRLDVVRKESGV
jgi:hypothetical protein